jgi:hypothetical protein
MKPAKLMIHRRGSILLYTVYLCMMMCVLMSVAVDYGRMQIVKTEAQRCADNVARGVLQRCLDKHTSSGYATALSMLQSQGQTIKGYLVTMNPVDSGSNITPTATLALGSWYGSPATFHANDWTGPIAVQVTVSRTVANGNPVPFTFPFPTKTGFLTKTQNITAVATAIIPNVIVLSQTVQATYDPWLAGMPSSTPATSYNDFAPAQSPMALTVIPGSTLTVVTAVTGQVQHGVNTGWDSADGNTSAIYWHMKDPPTGDVAEGQGAQNNIGDIITPIDSLTGLFLDSNQPSAANAPTTVRDYTTQAARDNPDFTNLQVQQPFYIGNGINGSGVTASFIVPKNATRFYMGIMDGYEWNNNTGSFSVGFNEQPPIQIVQ